jgi:hypothetical protein
MLPGGMNLSWRNDPYPRRRGTTKQSGSTLPLVLIFATIVFIAAVIYLGSQYRLSTHSLRKPASIQALLNARSGIWKALDFLVDSTRNDTMGQINTLDSLFGGDMFAASDGDSMLGEPIDMEETIFPLEMNPYSVDTFGDFFVDLFETGSFKRLESTGRYGGVQQRVEVKLGSSAPFSPDTLLYLYGTQRPIHGNGLLGGKTAFVQNPHTIDMKELSELITAYITDLSANADTSFLDVPTLIQSPEELETVPTMVNGNLLIDGGLYELEWRSDKKYFIMGDLQITGFCRLQGQSFVVGGDIKLFDKAHLDNVSLFTQSKLFIGDNAHFHGDALAMRSIVVYGNATVTDKSSLIVSGKRSVKKAKGKDTSAVSYAIVLSEYCTVDGSVVALQKPGNIKIEEEVLISGIVWAFGSLCHQGICSGVMCAKEVIECRDPLNVQKNSIIGSITHNANIKSYPLPSFMGKLSIIQWREE